MGSTNMPEHMRDAATPRLLASGRSPDRAVYKIKVRGCLDSSWSEWFDGLAISADTRLGETVLTGPVADQAALHGLLNKVGNLGLILLWLRRFELNGDGGPASAGECNHNAGKDEME
jgi:hypothetical protein